MRVIPGRFAIWIHGLAQMVAYTVYIASVGMGIYLVKTVQIPFGGGNLVGLSMRVQEEVPKLI